jgi:rhamnosyltransferase
MQKNYSQNELMPKICSLTITYFPEVTLLKEQISIISKNISHIFIVDNSADLNVSNELEKIKVEYSSISLILLPKNHGLAYGINIGLETINNQNFSHVIFFDQDSVPEKDMIDQLYSSFESIEALGFNVAAVGPTHFDPRTDYKSLFKGKSIESKGNLFPDIYPVSYLQTSGSLIKLDTLNEIGRMEEELFIHHIDLEWAYRAKSKNYTTFGINTAQMKHIVGNQVRRIWIGYWRDVHLNSPFRNFYIYRNSIILFRRNYISLAWKIKYSLHLVFLFIFTCLFGESRKSQFKMMIKGIFEGMSDPAVSRRGIETDLLVEEALHCNFNISVQEDEDLPHLD